MGNIDSTIPRIVERLSRNDPTLGWINLEYRYHTDEQLTELIDCLLAHPDIVTNVRLSGNQLTDKHGIKLARFLAISSTILHLTLVDNQFSDVTFLAIAAALRVNTSLRTLNLCGNQVANKSRVDAAFVDTLRFNPNFIQCRLYKYGQDYYYRLKKVADELGHPTMQSILTTKVFELSIY